MKVKALKFTKKITDFTQISVFAWKKASFTENVTALKSAIQLA